MQVFTNTPFSLELEPLLRQVSVKPESDDARELEELAHLAEEIAKPKAMYTESFVEAKDNDSVCIDGIVFKSRMLRSNLDAVERVFPFIATCGREVDEAFSGKGDFLKQFWWDTIKAHLLGAASKYLSDRLHRSFRLSKTSTMSPGSGDASVWPIEQQRALFELLGDVEGSIGVKLTDSFLMVPNKTVSGIRFPTERDFRSCQVCHRENCSSRSANFDEVLWKDMHIDLDPDRDSDSDPDGIR